MTSFPLQFLHLVPENTIYTCTRQKAICSAQKGTCQSLEAGGGVKGDGIGWVLWWQQKSNDSVCVCAILLTVESDINPISMLDNTIVI